MLRARTPARRRVSTVTTAIAVVVPAGGEEDRHPADANLAGSRDEREHPAIETKPEPAVGRLRAPQHSITRC